MSKRCSTVLGRWLGTPHLPGQRVRGVGVDCVQLVAAFLDEMARAAQPTVIPRLPQDSGATALWERALHDVLGAILGRYAADPVPCVHGVYTVEPGDILLCRIGDGGGPGHAMIVGGLPNTVYHADRSAGRVVRTGCSGVARLVRAWRTRDRHLWTMRRAP